MCYNMTMKLDKIQIKTAIKILEQIDFDTAYGKNPEVCVSSKKVLWYLRGQLDGSDFMSDYESYADKVKRLERDKDINEAKHEKAMTDFYTSHGIGDTYKHKKAFWDSQHADGYYISHVPEDDDEADKYISRVCEMTWISDKFPEDFIHC